MSITRLDSTLQTTVFRKSTFTGLATNFYSCIPLKYRLSAIQTLVHRAYKICSNWHLFHNEITFISKYFDSNAYPNCYVANIINNYLNKIYIPRIQIPTVPKDVVYVPMPYLGVHQRWFQAKLNKILSNPLSYINFRFAPTNPLSIGSLFKFKDSDRKSVV